MGAGFNWIQAHSVQQMGCRLAVRRSNTFQCRVLTGCWTVIAAPHDLYTNTQVTQLRKRESCFIIDRIWAYTILRFVLWWFVIRMSGICRAGHQIHVCTDGMQDCTVHTQPANCIWAMLWQIGQSGRWELEQTEMYMAISCSSLAATALIYVYTSELHAVVHSVGFKKYYWNLRFAEITLISNESHVGFLGSFSFHAQQPMKAVQSFMSKGQHTYWRPA